MAAISDFTICARSSGFLGDSEFAEDIIQKDAEYLDSVDILPRQVADILENYLYKGIYNNWDLGSRFKSLNRYIDWNEENNECPCGKLEHKLEPSICRYVISRNSDGRELEYNLKLLDVIRNHGFFGGHESKYRIDPQTIVEFFDMKPDVDYSLKHTIRKSWKFAGGSSHFQDYHEKTLKIIPELSFKSYENSEKGYRAFLVPSYLAGHCGDYTPKPEIDNYADRWTDFYIFKTGDHMNSTPEELKLNLRHDLKSICYYFATGKRKCYDGTYIIIFNPRRESGRWYIEDLNITFNVKDALATYYLAKEKVYSFDPEIFT